MTVCGKAIGFKSGVFQTNKKKDKLKCKGNPCSTFLKIQTILALNVWLKSALNSPENRFSRSPASM